VRAGLPHTAPTLDEKRRNARLGKDAGVSGQTGVSGQESRDRRNYPGHTVTAYPLQRMNTPDAEYVPGPLSPLSLVGYHGLTR